MIQYNAVFRADASESLTKELANYPSIGTNEVAAFVVDGHIVCVIENGYNAKFYRDRYRNKRNKLKLLIMKEEKQFSLSDLRFA